MEHRWCKRRGLVLEVRLTSPCGTACVARTRNVSMDGMFVDVKPDYLGDPKLVHVQLPATGIPCLQALVVHTREQGIGLMFCAVENRMRHLLARYLSDARGRRSKGSSQKLYRAGPVPCAGTQRALKHLVERNASTWRLH